MFASDWAITFKMALGKRSRSMAGARFGSRKRVRFARARQARPRQAAQRRFTKRAGWAVGRTSQSGGVRRTGYNTRKLRLPTYRNKLWENTRFKTHWRSRLAVTSTIPVVAAADTMTVALSTSWGGNEALGGSDTNFWQTSGGAQVLPEDQSFPLTADLTIRGGRWGRRWYNAGPTTVRLERWEVYFKREVPTGTTSTPFNIGVGWDPTYIDDFQVLFRVGRKMVTSIEPGDTFTIENKIPIAKIDQTMWAEGSQRAFSYTSYNTADNAAGSVIVTSWHSVSFSGDVSADNP